MSEAHEPIATLSDKRGLDLLEEVIEEIENHDRKTWRQDKWLSHKFGDFAYFLDQLPPRVQETKVPETNCGTTACLFGHVVFKGGAKLLAAHADDVDYAEAAGFVDAPYGESQSFRVQSIYSYARYLLLLNYSHADYLSAPSRDWLEILEFRDAWKNDAAISASETLHRDGLADQWTDDEPDQS